MKVATVRYAGSGNFVDEGTTHQIPWLNYRRLKLDPSRLGCFLRGLKRAIDAQWKIVVVPGGTASHLHIDLALTVGVQPAGLHRVGRAAVDLNGVLLIEALGAAGIRVCPELVTSGEVSQTAARFEGRDVIVVGASHGCDSTDALAAVSAIQSHASTLAIFKTGVPVYHVGFPRPTTVTDFSIGAVRRICAEFGQGPGRNSILDQQAIDTIECGRLATRLINPDHAEYLPEYLAGERSEFSTVISLDRSRAVKY